MGLDKEDIKQLIAILQKGLTDDTLVNKPEKERTPSKKAVKTTQKSAKPVRENKFNSMPEMNMHKDDVIFDQKVIVSPPTPRRSPFVPISVRCRICGKTEQANPSIIESPDRYKCNKCSSSAG